MGCVAPALLLRADADQRIGTGHLMRCLALAQAWKAKGGTADVVGRCEIEELRRRMEAAGIGFSELSTAQPSCGDLEQTLAIFRAIQAEWLVLDGYQFDQSYQQALRQAGCRLLVIDDMGHLPSYHADILLNQNIHAPELSYVRDPQVRHLLGTKFALLRPEFAAWRGWHREIPEVARKVLITMGGGDPENATLTVIGALCSAGVPGLEVRVVVGPANPYLEELRSFLAGSDFQGRLLTNVSDMPSVMAWADVAISGGGSTCWELAFMGLPALIVILAENQRNVAAGLHAAGTVINLGWHADLSAGEICRDFLRLARAPEVRASMAGRGRALVDGEGALRVVDEMRQSEISLRPVRGDDCRLIWEWANDPVTRTASFSSAPIPWEDHVIWFSRKLADPHCAFYLALDRDVPVGQVRYQVGGGEAIISVGLAPDQRGKGYGGRIIRLASHQVMRTMTVSTIHAYIKPESTPSIRAFTKAGFEDAGVADVDGHRALHYVLRGGTAR